MSNCSGCVCQFIPISALTQQFCPTRIRNTDSREIRKSYRRPFSFYLLRGFSTLRRIALNVRNWMDVWFEQKLSADSLLSKKARGKFCPNLMQLSVTLYKHDFNSSFTSVKLQVLRSKNVLVLPSTAFYNLNIEKKIIKIIMNQ